MEILAGISLAAIEQWGKTISGNNVKTKFPIAFTAFCMLSVSVNSSNGNAAESVFRNGFGYTNKTLSDWILRGLTSDATYFADYIAIGCQPQWGTNRTNGIYSFPIPFTEALCCFGGGEAGSGYYDNASAYSNTQVRVYSDGSSRFVSWIAIGA